MEHFLKQLIDGFSEPTLICDGQSGIIVVANNAAVKKLGYSQKSFKQSTFYGLFEPYLHGESSASVLYVKGQNYKISEDRLNFEDQTYYRYILRPLKATVSPELLLTAREMAKVLIHRVRSPLTGVSGFIEMIDAENAEKLGIDLEIIDQGFSEIRTILDKLESFTQSAEPSPVNIDLSGMLKDLIQTQPRKNKNRIRLDTSEGLPSLRTDFAMLQSILSELIQNATEHTDSELDELVIRTFKDGRIRIVNYGTPIPKSLSRRIFLPFITTKARHLGLGLPSAMLMAEKLEGKVYMASNSAIDGIQFEVSLPLRTA